METTSLPRRTVLQMGMAGIAGMALAAAGVRSAAGQTTAAAIPGADAADPLTPQLARVRLGVRKVADNVYMILGAGGNIGVYAGKDAVVVIDAGLPDRAKDVVTAVGIVAKGTPDLLVNTHYHFDHVGANEALREAGYSLVGHENVHKRLSEKIENTFLKMTFEPLPEKARPAVTFGEKLTLRPAGETLRLTHIPMAHTDGDAVVVFEKAGVMHTGDLFFNGTYPFIDLGVGGSVDGMIRACDTLLTMVDDKLKIIPGHGPVCGKVELQAFQDMLKQVRDAVKPLVEAGKTADEIVAADPLAKLNDKWGKGFLNGEMFTRLAALSFVRKVGT